GGVGWGRDVSERWGGEQGIGGEVGTAHSSAQLIELRQSEALGPVYDQRIGGRNVEAGFYDRGRQQHVIFAVIEGRHDVFEHGRRDLPVGHCDPCLRPLLVEEILGASEVRDTRATVEGWAETASS